MPQEITDATQRNSGIADRVRESATAQLSSQKDRATDGLGSMAQAVRQTTQQLRDQQHDTIAQYVEQAANQLDRFSQRLRDKDVEEIVTDVQRLARRYPSVFIGGAFALGVVGARFFKSSSRNQSGGFDREYGRERYADEIYGRGGYAAGQQSRSQYGEVTSSPGAGSSTSPATYDTGANTSGAGSSSVQSSSFPGSSSSAADSPTTGKTAATPRRRTSQTERS